MKNPPPSRHTARKASPKGELPVPDAPARRIVRAVFAGALLILAVWITRSYLVVVGWAAVLAVAIWPLYQRWAGVAAEKRGWVPPLLATILTALVLVVPIFLILAEIGRESQGVLQWMADSQQSGLQVPTWVIRLPLLGSHIEQWWRVHLSDPRGFADLFGGWSAEDIAGWTRSLGGELAYRLLLSLLTFMLLFILLRDGATISTRLLALSEQWLGYPGERLFEKMVVAVRGVVNGTVIVAIAEGLLIAIGYVWAGVPQPALFAIFTTAFAMVPLGAWFAFTAAALVLLVNGGSILAASGVFSWGAVVMLIGDTFVQPALIAGAARLPFLWVLIGILGGLETFGLLGLFLGPAIIAALVTIWRDWVSPES